LTALSDAERVDVRRHCGYPVYGAAPVGMQSWRFYQIYGLLEFRMTNLSDAECTIVRRYLATINPLELAVPTASENLDTDQAASWSHNRSEVADRIGLLDSWRRRLCGFLGIPTGPFLSDGQATFVV
jgi:hypothetical protein